MANESKVIVVYGARQVGKTTLIKEVVKESGLNFLSINADEKKYNEIFESRDLQKMERLIDRYEGLFLDEAQQIENIGLNLKILHDARPNLKIIVSGSSTLELSDTIKEPLTGRTLTHNLLPLSLQELREDHSLYELDEMLPDLLTYGLYPEVYTLTDTKRKREHLEELTRAYLYKDILQITNIRHSGKLYKLLQLLALQVSNTVSINKLSNALDISSETVNNYIDLLESSFVIFRRAGYSKNPAKEISKMDKIYFYDVGIRNALIQNFNPLDLRQDIGQLWENFIVAERLKYLTYAKKSVTSFFWRTYGGTEIDIVEAGGEELKGLEIKYTKKLKNAPPLWTETYPHATYEVINMSNWMDYMLM